jgi:hypothetical protein
MGSNNKPRTMLRKCKSYRKQIEKERMSGGFEYIERRCDLEGSEKDGPELIARD